MNYQAEELRRYEAQASGNDQLHNHMNSDSHVDVEESVCVSTALLRFDSYSDADEASAHHSAISSSLNLATYASWIVNILLLLAKSVVVVMSGSKAVVASLVDSVVDLLSQAVLSLAEHYIGIYSPHYPVGRSRLEALSVIACAFIMSMASVEVIQYSLLDIYNGLQDSLPYLYVDGSLYLIMFIAILLKLLLWLYCVRINAMVQSDMLTALAEDHLNDVLSNIVAVATAAMAFHSSWWWIDPVGAIVISGVIIYRWGDIIAEQVRKIVGFTAPQVFIDQVAQLAREHDSRIDVDCTRVYHFGSRYNVEMEIVLPGTMNVMESHDLALSLQHKVERLYDVERAFIHVDHKKRDGLEHKVERRLHRGFINS